MTLARSLTTLLLFLTLLCLVLPYAQAEDDCRDVGGDGAEGERDAGTDDGGMGEGDEGDGSDFAVRAPWGEGVR